MANKEISYVKDLYFELESKSLQSATLNLSSPKDLIVSLLNSLGIDKTLKEDIKSMTRYYSVTQSTRVELIDYDFIKKTISGIATANLEKAFVIIKSIEGELSDAMYYPADLRKKAIDLFIVKNGISVDFYKKIQVTPHG